MTTQEIFWLIIWPFIMIGVGSLFTLLFPQIESAVDDTEQKILDKIIDICNIEANEEDYEDVDNI